MIAATKHAVPTTPSQSSFGALTSGEVEEYDNTNHGI